MNSIVGLALQMKESSKDILSKIDDPAFSNEHKRILKLPNEHYPTFSKLRKHFDEQKEEMF